VESFLAKPSALRVMIFADAESDYKEPNDGIAARWCELFQSAGAVRERYQQQSCLLSCLFLCMYVVVYCWVNLVG